MVPPEVRMAMIASEIDQIQNQVVAVESSFVEGGGGGGGGEIIDTTTSTSSSESEVPTLKEKYSKILDTQTEMLTQALLKLDTIETPEERVRRKEQVTRVHELQVCFYFGQCWLSEEAY